MSHRRFLPVLFGLSAFASSVCLIACAASGAGGGGDPALEDGGGQPPASEKDASSKDGDAVLDKKDAAPVGPVTIKNLSGTRANDVLSLTFALSNKSTKDIERVKEITVSVGSGSASFATTCQNIQWNVLAGETSGVLEVSISKSGTTVLYLTYGSSCTTTAEETLSSSDDVTLQIKGLLEDATPWTAEAETTL